MQPFGAARSGPRRAAHVDEHFSGGSKDACDASIPTVWCRLVRASQLFKFLLLISHLLLICVITVGARAATTSAANAWDGALSTHEGPCCGRQSPAGERLLRLHFQLHKLCQRPVQLLPIYKINVALFRVTGSRRERARRRSSGLWRLRRVGLFWSATFFRANGRHAGARGGPAEVGCW